jgi:hypothetical protein
MMNPNVLLDLARERRRDLLEDAARSRQRTRVAIEPFAAEDALLVGRSAHAIDARVRAEGRRVRRASTALDLQVDAR